VQSQAQEILGFLGVVDAFLQFVLDVAVEEAGKQPGGVQRAVGVEPGGDEHLEELVQGTQRAQGPLGERAGQRTGHQQLYHVRVGQGDPPERLRGAAQGTLPITIPVTVRPAGDDDLGDDKLDDSVEKGMLVGGVPVDRHRVAIEARLLSWAARSSTSAVSSGMVQSWSHAMGQEGSGRHAALIPRQWGHWRISEQQRGWGC
jgi:hypothetical protein